MHVDVHLTPASTTDDDVEGRISVVIDVIRATSTIATALQAGAKAVRPAVNLDAVNQYASELEKGSYLRAGERNGVKIDGYDLGNSPLEYTEDVVNGKTVVLTTTNGTRAMAKAHASDELVVGSFLNAGRVARFIQEQKKDVVLLCAGRYNRSTLEDSLCAGFILDHLWHLGEQPLESDAARMAHMLYQTAEDNLKQTITPGSSSRRLHSIGHAEDVDYCLQRDTLPVLPRYNDGLLTV